MSVSVEKVLRASNLLDEAYREAECPWCAGQLKQLAEMTKDLAVVLPYTDETAMRVRNHLSDSILKTQGKIGVLKQVVEDSINGSKNAESAGNRKTFNTPAEHERNREIRGIRMNKRDTMVIVGSELGFGTLVGFGLNRLDEKYTKAGAQWYEHVGPAAKVALGAGMTVLGATGKVFKSADAQMIGVVGGGALLSQGALDYAEMLFASKAPVSSAKMVASRAPAPQAPYRPVMKVKTY